MDPMTTRTPVPLSDFVQSFVVGSTCFTCLLDDSMTFFTATGEHKSIILHTVSMTSIGGFLLCDMTRKSENRYHLVALSSVWLISRGELDANHWWHCGRLWARFTCNTCDLNFVPNWCFQVSECFLVWGQIVFHDPKWDGFSFSALLILSRFFFDLSEIDHEDTNDMLCARTKWVDVADNIFFWWLVWLLNSVRFQALLTAQDVISHVERLWSSSHTPRISE